MRIQSVGTYYVLGILVGPGDTLWSQDETSLNESLHFWFHPQGAIFLGLRLIWNTSVKIGIISTFKYDFKSCVIPWTLSFKYCPCSMLPKQSVYGRDYTKYIMLYILILKIESII